MDDLKSVVPTRTQIELSLLNTEQWWYYNENFFKHSSFKLQLMNMIMLKMLIIVGVVVGHFPI